MLFIRFAICLFLVSWCSYCCSDDKILEDAWNLINNKMLDDAENLLHQQLINTPDHSDTQFLFARTLAWNGKHSQALEILNQLLSTSPENTDYLFAKAQVLYWQSKVDSALSVIDKARKLSLDYQALWEFQLQLLLHNKTSENPELARHLNDLYFQRFGRHYINPDELKSQNNAVQIQQSKIPDARNVAKTKFLLTSYHHQQLDNSSPDWTAIQVGFGQRLEKLTYVITLDHEERFALKDQMATLSISGQSRPDLFLNAALTTGSTHKLLPVWSSTLGATMLMSKQWSMDFQWQHKSYKTITTDTTSPSIFKRWNKFQAGIRGYFVALNNNDVTLSASTQLAYFFNDISMIRFSYTQGKELEYTEKKNYIYVIKNYSLDGKVFLTPSFHLIYAFSHHIQGKAYKKDGIHLGLQYYF